MTLNRCGREPAKTIKAGKGEKKKEKKERDKTSKYLYLWGEKNGFHQKEGCPRCQRTQKSKEGATGVSLSNSNGRILERRQIK